MKGNAMRTAAVAASALLLAFSCTKQDAATTEGQAKVFTATVEQSQTKTTLEYDSESGQYIVNWDSGDLININAQAVYSAEPDSRKAGVAEFTLDSGQEPESPYAAIYPASLCDPEDGKLYFPPVQEYASGRCNAPMAALSADERLTFHNVCGVLCFSLTGSGIVHRIELTSKDHELWGPFKVDYDTWTAGIEQDGNAPAGGGMVASPNTVTLFCGDEGVQLNGDEPTDFYVYLPAGEYGANDLDVCIASTDGGECCKTAAGDVKVERNRLYNFVWDVEFTHSASADTVHIIDPPIAADETLIADTPEGKGMKLSSNEEVGTSNVDNVYCYDIECVPSLFEPKAWDKQIQYDGLSLDFGATYRLRVKARVSQGTYGMCAFLQVPKYDYPNCGDLGTMTLTDQWQDFVLTAECTLDEGQKLIFNIGDYDGHIYIASVTLEKIQESTPKDEVLIAQFGLTDILHWQEDAVSAEQVTVDNVDCIKISTQSPATNPWDNQFACDIPNSLENGKTYKVKVKIKTSDSFSIPCTIQYPDENEWPSFSTYPYLETTTDWQVLTCIGHCNIDNASRINFSIGDFVGDFYVAEVEIYELNEVSNVIAL